MTRATGRWCAETETQVQFFDLDPMEVVWHGHYVKYLEIARGALLDSIDYNYPEMRDSGYLWPVDRFADPLRRARPIRRAPQAARRDRRVGESSQDRIFDQRSQQRKTPNAGQHDSGGGRDRYWRDVLCVTGCAVREIEGDAVMAGGVLACAAALAVALAATAPTEKIQALLAKPKVLCGRFDQTKLLVGLKKPVTSNGRFCVVVDKGVLWRTLEPFPNTLRVTRDEIVQMHGERVALRLDARREPALRMVNNILFALFAGDLGRLESFFEIAGTVGEKTWSVTLKAREPALAKTIARVGLEGGMYVRNVTISEANGDVTQIVFSAIQTGDGAMNADEAALF